MGSEVSVPAHLTCGEVATCSPHGSHEAKKRMRRGFDPNIPFKDVFSMA
jgi:hypothetical protein